MVKQTFVPRSFQSRRRLIIEQANQILIEYYEANRRPMTVRQLFYQLVSHHGYKNDANNASQLSDIMSDARLAGLTDWDHIEDRGRELQMILHWSSPAERIKGVAGYYREDLWIGQKYRPEVWIEKDALAGVIADVCDELRVSYFACRGFVSTSMQYEAAKRFQSIIDAGQTPIVFHLGDHDPSGLHMTDENREKFKLLVGKKIEVRRLALNIGQVRKYRLPPNPAKETDTRFEGYEREFGTKSWELDALPPKVIQQLIRDNVSRLIDRKKWAKAERAEKKNKALLGRMPERWDRIVETLS